VYQHEKKTASGATKKLKMGVAQTEKPDRCEGDAEEFPAVAVDCYVYYMQIASSFEGGVGGRRGTWAVSKAGESCLRTSRTRFRATEAVGRACGRSDVISANRAIKVPGRYSTC
jgi:hypothetical protein